MATLLGTRRILMAPNPSVIAAIEASVASDPANSALRVHLAELLLEADRGQDALAQLEVVLQNQPDDIEALGLAGRAGLIVGDPRATGWTRLHQALSGSPSDPSEEA